MKLHRLELTNFKGITHREIRFPDRGVVVVCGPNEVGKSSMIEALDLLLEVPAKSKKENVRQIQPANADVGTEVAAEISTGKYRFKYRKRFNKKAETTLTVLEPVPENLNGEPAHERVLAMLAETMDMGLWKAQRVLQSSPTAAVSLSGSDALSKALDMAAVGNAEALSGSDSLLTGAIDTEFVKYFTPATGKPAKEWKDAQAALVTAKDEVSRCRAAIEEVESLVDRHADLTGRRGELAVLVQAAVERRSVAKKAADALTELTTVWTAARDAAEAARKIESASVTRRDERLKLRDNVVGREHAIAELRDTLTAATEAERIAGVAGGKAAEAVQQSTTALAEAEKLVKRTRAIADGVDARNKLADIDGVQADMIRIDGDLAAITMTPEAMAQIVAAVAQVGRFTDQLSLNAGIVEFTPVSNLALLVDGEPVTLPAGQSWRPTSSVPTTLELPGVLSVRIDPGPTTAEVQAELSGAQEYLDGLLAAAGVDDAARAQEIEDRRKGLVSRWRELAAQLTGLCGSDEPSVVVERLTALVAALPEGEDFDLDAARAGHAAAEEALEQVRVTNQIDREAAEAANKDFNEKATAAKVAHTTLAGSEAELVDLREKLIAQRAEADDDQLIAAATAEAEKLTKAEAAVAEVAAKRDALKPVEVEAELSRAAAADEKLKADLGDVDRQLNELNGALELAGSEGRKGKLDEAEAIEEAALRDVERIGRRARSINLLKKVMDRHRDDTQKRYAEPFRKELERLAKPVFGDNCQLTIDSDLSIISRTLDCVTVPYELLSGGVKEQLGILVRLAGAALVADEDTVPVVIDDALGFADPERLDSMRNVLGDLGGEGQVIVLTCTPDRYDGVAGAEFIELGT